MPILGLCLQAYLRLRSLLRTSGSHYEADYAKWVSGGDAVHNLNQSTERLQGPQENRTEEQKRPAGGCLPDRVFGQLRDCLARFIQVDVYSEVLFCIVG